MREDRQDREDEEKLRGVPLADDADEGELWVMDDDSAEAVQAEVDNVENENPADQEIENIQEGALDFDEQYDGYLGPDPPELPPEPIDQEPPRRDPEKDRRDRRAA